jgi:hypothetical protein
VGFDLESLWVLRPTQTLAQDAIYDVEAGVCLIPINMIVSDLLNDTLEIPMAIVERYV